MCVFISTNGRDTFVGDKIINVWWQVFMDAKYKDGSSLPVEEISGT